MVCATEALMTTELTRTIVAKLAATALEAFKGEMSLFMLHTFTAIKCSLAEVEMPSQVSLLWMDLNGVGIDEAACSELLRRLDQKCKALESSAHQLAGRKFNMNSRKDVVSVLRSMRLFSHVAGRKEEQLPIKEILVQVQEHHILPKVIAEWRRIHTAISNVRKRQEYYCLRQHWKRPFFN